MQPLYSNNEASRLFLDQNPSKGDRMVRMLPFGNNLAKNRLNWYVFPTIFWTTRGDLNGTILFVLRLIVGDDLLQWREIMIDKDKKNFSLPATVDFTNSFPW